MLSLTDDHFFDIIRNYLGPVKTPFNKQSLVEKLAAFLYKPSTKERVLELIDQEDARMLTAIYLLHNPKQEVLFAFFEGERTILDMYHHLLNLEERLIIQKREEVIHFSPFFEDEIIHTIVDPEILFPFTPFKGQLPSLWLNEKLVIAFVSYLLMENDLFTTSKTIKKKHDRRLESIFPILTGKTPHGTNLELLITALYHLKLLVIEGQHLKPCKEAFSNFCNLSSKQRTLLLLGGLLCNNIPELEQPLTLETEKARPQLFDDNAPFTISSLDQAHKFAKSINAFLDSFKKGCGLPLSAALQLLGVSLFPHNPDSKLAKPFYELLLAAGALALDNDNTVIENEISIDGASEHANPLQADPPLVVQPNLTVLMKPHISFSLGLLIATCAQIKKYDIYMLFELNKNSYIRAREWGYSSEDINKALEASPPKILSQSVRFSLQNWEDQFSGISLFEAVVLVIDEKRRHLIEHSKLMSPYIKLKLPGGIYLLDGTKKKAWTKALQETGIDPVPQINNFTNTAADCNGIEYSVFTAEPLITTASFTLNTNSPADRSACIDGLLNKAEETFPPGDIREELYARIRKKLILFPQQIHEGTCKIEKSEARGIDYLGKIRLIEQAISSSNELLEIIERTPGGAPQKRLLKPRSIKKNSQDLILIGTCLPNGLQAQIPIRKIVFLKKLKGSLFAPLGDTNRR